MPEKRPPKNENDELFDELRRKVKGEDAALILRALQHLSRQMEYVELTINTLIRRRGDD